VRKTIAEDEDDFVLSLKDAWKKLLLSFRFPFCLALISFIDFIGTPQHIKSQEEQPHGSSTMTTSRTHHTCTFHVSSPFQASPSQNNVLFVS
jgi:hypothetical protein